MDENEIAERFSDIIKTELLLNDPHYRQLMLNLDLAAVEVFNYIKQMGHNDISSIKSQAYNLRTGKLEDFFKYTLLMEVENEDGTT